MRTTVDNINDLLIEIQRPSFSPKKILELLEDARTLYRANRDQFPKEFIPLLKEISFFSNVVTDYTRLINAYNSRPGNERGMLLQFAEEMTDIREEIYEIKLNIINESSTKQSLVQIDNHLRLGIEDAIERFFKTLTATDNGLNESLRLMTSQECKENVRHYSYYDY